MKRKTSTTPTKTWSFGALPPTDGAELISEQLFLANKYYNTLIEIERRRRDKFREARSDAAPALALLEAEWNKLDLELEAGITALPKVAGKKKLTLELLALKERRKEVSARMKAERAAFLENTQAKERTRLLNDAALLEVKAARAATDLYWGSYLLIEKQMEQVRKSKLDPRFRRYDGSGCIGVQFQKGLTLPELLSGEDTRLRLVARTSTPKVKRPKALHEVQIRVGSNGRAPIWATFPVVIHRDIPPDANIKWAWIKVQSIAGQRKFFLQLVMESETFVEQAPRGRGVVAINFGWRAHPDGSRRVGYAVDDAGKEQEFRIPAAVEGRLAHASVIRSARDLHFEEAKRALGAFMAIQEVPEWLKTDSAHLWQWRSPQKLARLASRLTKEILSDDRTVIERWRTERLTTPKRDLFAPAAEIFAWVGQHNLRGLAVYLELWRLKNRHLWKWEATERLKAQAHRNELFRIWARNISTQYSEVCIEKFDLRKMAAEPPPEEENRPSQFRVTRAAAAPGKFRSRIVEVCKARIIMAPAHGNTIICHECGHVNERALTHRIICGGCAEDIDQDANNCRNQLLRKLGGEPGSRTAAE